MIIAALRVPMEVTWLTVYRQLQIDHGHDGKQLFMRDHNLLNYGTNIYIPITFCQVHKRSRNGKYESTHTIPHNPSLFPFKNDRDIKT